MTPNLAAAAKAKREELRANYHERMLVASAGGYFWLPCPICSECFGGHEWVDRISIPAEGDTDGTLSTGICPACELDLGAQAGQLCEREGHGPVDRFGGRRTSMSTDDEGRHTGSWSFDLSTVSERYCGTCGVDLPLEPE